MWSAATRLNELPREALRVPPPVRIAGGLPALDGSLRGCSPVDGNRGRSGFGQLDEDRLALDLHRVHARRCTRRRPQHLPCPDVELTAMTGAGERGPIQLAFGQRAADVGTRRRNRIVLSRYVRDGDGLTGDFGVLH